MNGTGEYYAMWNKPSGERQIPHDLTYKWNLINKILFFFLANVTLPVTLWKFSFFVFFKNILFICRQRAREGARERDKHQCVVVSSMPSLPTGDLARNPGTCPDWKLNWRPFGLSLVWLSYTSQGCESLFICLLLYPFLCMGYTPIYIFFNFKNKI